MTVFVSIVILFILIFCFRTLNKRKRHKENQELIKTVTTSDRGTNSELRLILKLLKVGIPSETIFHEILFQMEFLLLII